MTRTFIILSFLSILWISCRDDNMSFDIGSDNIDIKTHMGFIDTFTINSYTVLLDSIPTSRLQAPAILIGKYHDEELGTVSASSFFRVSLAGSRFSINQNAVFDSLRLLLAYDQYYEGDTTLPFRINIYRLQDNLEPNENGYFYNVDSIACLLGLFGEAEFYPQPHSTDSVSVKLNSAFGQQIFEYMKQNADIVTQSEFFQDYFKGFMLRYDESNEALIGFKFPSSSGNTFTPVMRLYFHYTLNDNVFHPYYDFKAQMVENDFLVNMQFNKIALTNRTLDFPSGQQISYPASLTNNRSYVQAGTGIVTRLEIPYLKDLYSISRDIRILHAELVIEPVRNTYLTIPLPDQMSLYTTDNINHWGSLIYTKYGREQTGNLVTDLLNQEETRYTFDVTNFIITKLEKPADVIPALLLTVSVEELYKTTQRVVLGSQKNPVNKVKLKVYYMNLD